LGDRKPGRRCLTVVLKVMLTLGGVSMTTTAKSSRPSFPRHRETHEMREPLLTKTMQIGIVVRDLDKTIKRYSDELGSVLGK
jgi:hypothetical protein